MAEVLIMLRDSDDAGVEIGLTSDPPFRGDELKGAQALAMAMLSSVSDPSDITHLNGKPVP